MKKTLLFLAFIVSTLSFAQTNGITYQAVIYSTNGESVPGINNSNAPLANKNICLQFSIVDDFSQTEYQEKITVTTDDYGMVNLIIGTGTQTGGYANSFESIVWNSAKKYLKVSLDQSGKCNSFDEISNQVLSYVPFALAANSTTSVSGIVGIANGGTNATTITGAKTNLQLQNVDNTRDLDKPIATLTQTALNSKVDKVVGKELSSNDYSTAEKTKLAAISGVNTGDQDLSSYATSTTTTTALALKVDKVSGKELSSNDFSTAEKTKLAAISGVNTGDQDLSSFVTATALTNKVDKVTGKELSTNDYTTAEKTKLAAISGVNTGDQDLSSYATTTSTTTALALKVDKVSGKELSSNDFSTAEKTKLAAISGVNTGDQDLSSFVTATALTNKVDKVTGKELSTNDYTTAEKTKLAAISGVNTGDQDLSSFVTATALTNKVDKVAGKELSSNDYTTVEKSKLAAITGNNTGDQDLSSFVTATALTNKVDKVTGKELSTNDYTTAEKTKLAAISGVNTGDQDLNSFVPFNGALNSVNLGNKDLSANNLYGGRINDINVGIKGTGETNYLGTSALAFSSGGFANTAIGHFTLTETQGDENTAIGAQAMRSSTTGSRNTAVGRASLNGNLSGSNNTSIGYNTRVSSTDLNNTTAIGAGAVVSASNTIQLGNTAVTNVKTSGKLTTGAITLPNTDGTLGQVLATNGAGVLAWSSPANISISTINETPNSNGATIANGIIKLSPADATNGGIVTTGNQTFSGNKIVVGNFETQTSMNTPVKDINANNPTSPIGAPDQEARQSFTAGISGYLSNIKVKLFSSGTYTVSIYKGGNVMSENNPGGIQLFQTTFTSINNVMSNIPITNTPITAGDIYWIKISGTSLNVGLNWGQNNVGTTVSFPNYRGGISQSWIFETYVSQLIGGNITVAGSITSSGFKTPTGTSSQYLMADGSVTSGSSGSTSASVDLTSNQTIAGSKTFSSDLNVSGLTIGGTSNTTILGANASGGPFSTTIGNNASSPSSYSVAIGRYSNAMTSYSVAIGGLNAKASESYSIAIGGNAPEATGVYSTAIGGNVPKATALQSTALGSSTTASGQNSTALGYGATVSSDNTIQLGNTSVTDVKTSGSLTAKSIISLGKMVMSTATIEYSQLNNYDVSNVSILFVKPNSTWTNIYGLSGGTIGQIIHIYSVNNQTSNCCTALSLWNYDSSSNTGIQKFVAPGGINIGSNEDTTLVFDGTYWRVSKFGM